MDGEYWLYPAHYGDVMKVRVYCQGMDTDKPKDYISRKLIVHKYQ